MAYSVQIDFEVFKALTALRESEDDDYNDVLRRLLQLPIAGDILPEPPIGGCWFSDVYFPENTQFRVTYKGSTYAGVIRNGAWVDGNGVNHSSPSSAATSITGTNVNGWRFWFARRPTDNSWIRLDHIRGSESWASNRRIFQ